MSPETWNAILVVIVVVLAGYTIYTRYRAGQVTNLSTVISTVEEKIPFATELSEVAQIVVNEIEQAVREGVVLSNDEKFNRALDLVKGWDPRFKDIENHKVISAIKSAVLVASTLTNAITADKATTATAEEKGIDVS